MLPQPGHALIVPEALHWETLRKKPEFRNAYLLEGYLNLVTFSFALRKDWKHTARVNGLFDVYAELGIFNAITRRHRESPIVANPNWASRTPVSIKIDRFIPLYAMLITGAVLSCLLTVGVMVRERRRAKTSFWSTIRNIHFSRNKKNKVDGGLKDQVDGNRMTDLF